MKKRFFFLLLTAMLCCAFLSSAEEGASSDFRQMPGYTCYPMTTESSLFTSDFCADCPMEWDWEDFSMIYGFPTIMAAPSFEDMEHTVLIAQLNSEVQNTIQQDQDHPFYGFLMEGKSVLGGKSTSFSRILEQFDLHGLPAVRVEMVGQGFEMVWIQDPNSSVFRQSLGTCWFFMYPTDPENAEYTEIVRGIIDSFTAHFPESIGTAPEKDFTYSVTDGEVCILSYLGEGAYVNVPSKIEGCPVTAMGDQAFYETSVRCVSLPDTIRTLGHHTFGGCTDLIYADMPQDLEVLPPATFESCFRLMEPGLNDGLKKIESTAFWGNQYLTGLMLPESLEEIEDNAFTLCDHLGYILVPEANRHFKGNEDAALLLSADGETLIWYSFLNEDEAYQVPDGVRHIHSLAFHNAPLTSVILPDGLESIGFNAFSGTGLTELTLPESVTSIGRMENVLIGESEEPTTVEYLSLGDSIRTIHGVPGSAAEEYAKRQNLTFVPETGSSQ